MSHLSINDLATLKETYMEEPTEHDKKDKYLGDGVYASFDGYHIVLAKNRHDNYVISLEPYVIERLVWYAKSLKMIK